MRQTISVLQQQRYQYSLQGPAVLQAGLEELTCYAGESTGDERDAATLEVIQQRFPHTHALEAVQFSEAGAGEKPLTGHQGNFAVILSGGQAPGGHNVIAGLFDALQALQPEGKLFGFCGGPAGLVGNKCLELTAEVIDRYRNTGGFDIIGSGRTKLEHKEQFARVAQVCRQHNIKTVIVIGGDDSNTNAALLAEYFLAHQTGIGVVGCPKTIDGDLKGGGIEVSFGFDTATKTYAELIGNIARDAISARKYWHFIRLMGRSASHITLECALSCRPDITLISEEVQARQLSLEHLVEQISDVVIQRAQNGKNYGLVLIPEGLIEFLPGFGSLIQQLNDLLAEEQHAEEILASTDLTALTSRLSGDAQRLFLTLPSTIQRQLLADRDPHGNVQVSLIETEKLLVELVARRLAKLGADKFTPVTHFFGYEGRSCFPSNFDAAYCYALGKTAYLLGASGHTGYIACVRHLNRPVGEWQCWGVPVTSLLTVERRHGADKPVIKKALVDLNGRAFRRLRSLQAEANQEDNYLFPGPIQFFGPTELCDRGPITLQLESQILPLAFEA